MRESTHANGTNANSSDGPPDGAQLTPSRLDPENSFVDLAEVRRRLEEKKGPKFWRSFEELAETPEFDDYLNHEFPAGADSALDPVTRRGFLKVMGASFALAGLGACVKQPAEKIVPYVKQPEELVPGRPLFFATATTLNGYATGVLVESHMGRPTKIEGNPDHPASLGATDVFTQAEVLTLYDPDRAALTYNRDRESSWEHFSNEFSALMEGQIASRGAGLRILTDTVTSPTFAAQMEEVLATFPEAKWYSYEATSIDGARAALREAFNRPVDAIYDFASADTVLSLDADFMMDMPGSVRYARDFMDRRRIVGDVKEPDMNRLYTVESNFSNTGAMSDHRLAARAAQIEGFARMVAAGLGIAGADAPAPPDDASRQWVAAVVDDLKASRGRSIVLAGRTQPASVHRIVHAINSALGNDGKTVRYIDAVEASATEHTASLRELAREMDNGQVKVLVTIGVNPVYTAPADLEFQKLYDQKVATRVYMGLFRDETAFRSDWFVPMSHSLESWSDARAFDGTSTIIQPLIAPLYATRTPHQLVAAMLGNKSASDHDLIQKYWKTRASGVDFESTWEKALHDGVMPLKTAAPGSRPLRGTATATSPATTGGATATSDTLVAGAVAAGTAVEDSGATAPMADTTAVGTGNAAIPPMAAGGDSGLEIVFRPDPRLWDGRFANNGWLVELPQPMTKITWDNVAQMSPKTAEQNDVDNGDVVELEFNGRTITAPAWIVPGHPNDSVTVLLGWGRTRAGRVGDGIGYNAYKLRTSDAPWFGSGLKMRPTGDSMEIANTQMHASMENRDLIRVGTLAEYVSNPTLHEAEDGEAPGHEARASLYAEYEYNGYAWGMTLDLNACMGCGACTIACQAENNIPVVGKEQVLIGREMHWIRVDRYYSGGIDEAQAAFQPVPCMHCEKAPCEVVCPVNATVHDAEGLNDMVYNRCIGTRYCSNNCPYKVRRFNFLNYNSYEELTPEKMAKNPDVTIRSRGVMEKCTYCVQRISHARIDAKVQGRKIRDGEIDTACQAVCPTDAIVFGDINDKESRVSKLKAARRNYQILTELNTEPRTSYLGRVMNPNPRLDAPRSEQSTGEVH